jgi:plasmid maintenance system antidote protein VapI
MYVNLRKLLRDKGISLKAFAELLEITEKSAQNKLFGATDFTLKEAKKIMTLFMEYNMEYLFSVSEKAAGEAATGDAA